MYIILTYVFKNANTQYDMNIVRLEIFMDYIGFLLTKVHFHLQFVVNGIYKGKYIREKPYPNTSFGGSQNEYKLDGSKLSHNR